MINVSLYTLTVMSRFDDNFLYNKSNVHRPTDFCYRIPFRNSYMNRLWFTLQLSTHAPVILVKMTVCVKMLREAWYACVHRTSLELTVKQVSACWAQHVTFSETFVLL